MDLSSVNSQARALEFAFPTHESSLGRSSQNVPESKEPPVRVIVKRDSEQVATPTSSGVVPVMEKLKFIDSAIAEIAKSVLEEAQAVMDESGLIVWDHSINDVSSFLSENKAHRAILGTIRGKVVSVCLLKIRREFVEIFRLGVCKDYRSDASNRSKEKVGTRTFLRAAKLVQQLVKDQKLSGPVLYLTYNEGYNRKVTADGVRRSAFYSHFTKFNISYTYRKVNEWDSDGFKETTGCMTYDVSKLDYRNAKTMLNAGSSSSNALTEQPEKSVQQNTSRDCRFSEDPFETNRSKDNSSANTVTKQPEISAQKASSGTSALNQRIFTSNSGYEHCSCPGGKGVNATMSKEGELTTYSLLEGRTAKFQGTRGGVLQFFDRDGKSIAEVNTFCPFKIEERLNGNFLVKFKNVYEQPASFHIKLLL